MVRNLIKNYTAPTSLVLILSLTSLAHKKKIEIASCYFDKIIFKTNIIFFTPPFIKYYNYLNYVYRILSTGDLSYDSSDVYVPWNNLTTRCVTVCIKCLIFLKSIFVRCFSESYAVKYVIPLKNCLLDKFWYFVFGVWFEKNRIYFQMSHQSFRKNI